MASERKEGKSGRASAKAKGSKLVLGLFFVASSMVLLLSAAVFIQMNRHFSMYIESKQNHLLPAALAASKYISAETLDLYHKREDTDNAEYMELKNSLARFAEDYRVLYVYYWRQYGSAN